MLFDIIAENDVINLKEKIELGANIHEIDDSGYTPLMHASRFGHIEIAKLLLESSADINDISKLDLL